MEDGTVSDREIEEQAGLVLSLYQNLDKTFDERQLAVIAEVIAETGVLHSVIQYAELQEFHR